MSKLSFEEERICAVELQDRENPFEEKCFWCGKGKRVRQLSCQKCIGSSGRNSLIKNGWGDNYPVGFNPNDL